MSPSALHLISLLTGTDMWLLPEGCRLASKLHRGQAQVGSGDDESGLLVQKTPQLHDSQG